MGGICPGEGKVIINISVVESQRIGQRIRQQMIPQSDQFKLDEDFEVVLSLEGDGQTSNIIMDIIFIIDVSGSMDGIKIDLAKKSLIIFSDLMNQKNKENQMAIVSFESNAQLEMAWTPTNDDNINKIHANINKLTPRGYTNITLGFKEAMKELVKKPKRESVTYIILLSDGGDNEGGGNCLNSIKSIMEKARISFIYGLQILGYGKDQDDVLLDDIAQLKHGEYRNIRDIQDAESYFRQLFHLMERTFANLKIEVNIIAPFQVSSYNQEDFIRKGDKLQAKLELFKIGDTQDYFLKVICKSEKAQNFNEVKPINFMRTKIDGDLICQNKIVVQNIEAPKLTLCSDQTQNLEINPVFEQKQLIFESKQVFKEIIVLEKQNKQEEVKRLANEMLIRLNKSKQTQEPQIIQAIQTYNKVKSNNNSDNRIQEFIEDKNKFTQVQLQIETESRPQEILEQRLEIIEFQQPREPPPNEPEEDLITSENRISQLNIALLSSTRYTNVRLTEVEYNNLIMLNVKVVIVVYNLPSTKSKLKEIENLFQDQLYEDIKLCMIDQKYHEFLDQTLISDLSILIYHQHQLKEILSPPQSYEMTLIVEMLGRCGIYNTEQYLQSRSYLSVLNTLNNTISNLQSDTGVIDLMANPSSQLPIGQLIQPNECPPIPNNVLNRLLVFYYQLPEQEMCQIESDLY